ncbi:MAG TPA: hypothetical protein VJU85_03580 [Nitrososphaeraceae archaeon]|nr:hypothetical protein [Nitrososphaeraceae archaeon]
MLRAPSTINISSVYLETTYAHDLLSLVLTPLLDSDSSDQLKGICMYK